MVEYHPISVKDQSRLHQVLPGFFLGYVLSAGANLEKRHDGRRTLKNWEMDASELHARRVNAKEVSTPMKRWKFFICPVAERTVEISGALIRNSPDRGEEQYDIRGETDGSSFYPTTRLINVWWWSQKWILVYREFIYHHHVEPPESNRTSRLKNHSLFHCNTLTLPELPKQFWMWCRRNILTITGTLMATENCRMHGQDSRDSLYWMRNHLMDIHGPVRDWLGNKRLQDPTRWLHGHFLHLMMKNSQRLMHRNACRKLKIPMPAAMPWGLQLQKHRDNLSAQIGQNKYLCLLRLDDSMNSCVWKGPRARTRRKLEDSRCAAAMSSNGRSTSSKPPSCEGLVADAVSD